jgi:hypothetical protein
VYDQEVVMKTLVAHKKQIPFYSQLPSDVIKEVKDFTAKVEKNLYELFQCAAFRQEPAEKTGRKEVKAKRARVPIARKKKVAA